MNTTTKRTSRIYNPDAPIDAEQRSKNIERALPRYADDPVRSFSRWEIQELRRDLQSLNTLRAERFVTLIEAYETSEDYPERVSEALSRADLEGLVELVSTTEDELHGELTAKDDEINEMLSDNPESSPAELCTRFRLWHAAEQKRLKDEITEKLSEVTKGLENAKEALAELSKG